jgi:hypothetical protein
MAYHYHRRHKKALEEASNSASYSDADSASSPGNVSTSNHCEEWNPNQIVYNKVYNCSNNLFSLTFHHQFHL